MSRIRAHRYLIARRVTQIGVLSLFWLGAHQHLSWLTGNLSSATLFGTVPLSDPFAVLQILATGHPLSRTVLLGAAVVLLFYLFVGGRVFCSWICPVNMVTDLSGWLRKRLRLGGQFRIDARTRYWFMGLALPISAIAGVAAFEWVSPIGITHRELIYGPGLGLMVVGGIFLLDLMVVQNGWCGSLCPLGGFYSLVGHRSLVRIGFDVDRCDRCGECVPVCPVPHVIHFNDMAARGLIDSGECSNCARCLEVCPRGAFHFTLRSRARVGTDRKRGGQYATESAMGPVAPGPSGAGSHGRVER